MGNKNSPSQKAQKRADEKFARGRALVAAHPLFAPMLMRAHVDRTRRNLCPDSGWVVVARDGHLHVHPSREAAPEEWAYMLAHALLHLGFGHIREDRMDRAWNAACDCYVARFLTDFKFGRPPAELRYPVEFSARSEEQLYKRFLASGIPPALAHFGTAGPNPDMLSREERSRWLRPVDWEDLFSRGLSAAVSSALRVAAGEESALGEGDRTRSAAQRARDWFMSSYPLLGALAASFEIIEDPIVCGRLGVSVAAVDARMREVYLNPAAALNEEECRFVIAHELLHVGLRHTARRRGRDPFLWNAACDYVINDWLHEMKIGAMPEFGLLFDKELRGLSAESIYDRIVTDLRRNRRLATFAGVGAPDMLEDGESAWWSGPEGVTLDEFYRRCLSQGLYYHRDQSRGLLPAGLVEEIRALSQPPLPWDVELAQWFDHHFSPVQRRRTYARPSRRQAATPDIPRPRYCVADEDLRSRTFGVVFDTSLSMDRTLLAKGLGAIASYSVSREVPAARVVFCDAVPHDEGFIPATDIAERVQVKGRGGTVLQPGIDLLQEAPDFPDEAPILVITDGMCDRLRLRREHAFLMPRGASLPFVPRGPVFWME